MVEDIINKISNTEYDTLLSNSLKNSNIKEKTIISGIVEMKKIVTIDVGLKSEGRIPLNEFSTFGQKAELNVGDKTEVYIENLDNSDGETTLSREKAVKQKAWHELQDSFANNKVVTESLLIELKVE